MAEVEAAALDAEEAERILRVLQSDQAQRIISEITRAAVFRDALGQQSDSLNVDRVAWLAACMTSATYAQAHTAKAYRFPGAGQLLQFAVAQSSREGLFLEFGVYSARTINWIAELVPEVPVYGFDSFAGLPEAWRPGYNAGSFKLSALPKVRSNIELVVGWFDRTLPTFLDRFPDKPVAFLHVDCDLYSSTQTIFAQLKSRIVPGTVIVFDEYFNYPGWEGHEYQAFAEFIQHTGLRYKYLGLVPNHQQVCVRILG